MSKRKILIIEDDRDIVEMLEYNLREEGYQTISALNGEKGIALAGKEQPDLIILDIMLPVMDGFEVCRTLKNDEKVAHIPIIILSAKSQETDKVVGLELGADDYVTKPFSPRELIARTRAILRRGREEQLDDRIQRGKIIIDRTRHKVTVGEKEISLTLTEFKLLEFMARRPGAVFSRSQILDAVAGQDTIACDRTVDAHIKSLRHKLGAAKEYIETIRGAGYRFKEV
ncbi:MAG: response regulator [Planctomycetota bacterium]|jgi:phosphate regulon transcriptional regulator PhoB